MDLTIGKTAYFYLYSPGDALAFIHATIVEERDKSIKILMKNGKHEYIPKSALKTDKHQPQNYQVAKWVRFNDVSAIECV